MNIHSKRFVVGAGWLVAVSIGMAVVLNYESAGGHPGQTPSAWPPETSLTRDSVRPTLVLFAHPKCPCTRASLGELNRLLARCENRVAAHVFFFKPEGQTDNWVKSDLWRSVANIPGLALHEDGGGREAGYFGAQTSGQVVLYDPRGRLLFRGGITAGRGHAGDNAGENLILALLAGEDSGLGMQTPVFGCSLRETAAGSAN